MSIVTEWETRIETFYGFGKSLTEAVQDAQGNANRWLGAHRRHSISAVQAQTIMAPTIAGLPPHGMPWAHIISITASLPIEEPSDG